MTPKLKKKNRAVDALSYKLEEEGPNLRRIQFDLPGEFESRSYL